MTKPDKTVTPVSFATAKRRLGDKDRVKLDRNTYLERRGDKRIAVILHATDIVTFTPSYTELDSGGWHTMVTRSRMEDYIPMSLRAGHEGWHLFPHVELPCYCLEDRERGTDGIVIDGEWQPGQTLRFTGFYQGPYGNRFEERGPDDKPIYAWRACGTCQGTGVRRGPDWASGGFVYFDGIRINPTGTRLMVKQPNAPRGIAEPVVTVSGWSGTSRARRANEPFYVR